MVKVKGMRPLKRWELPALAAILLLAIVLRVGWPTATEFKFSEARLEALALELTQEGRLPLVGVPSSAGFDHSPISVYLYLPAFLFTADPVPATVYGGLAGVAAVALCWWLARRWPGGGRHAALVTTLVFAVSPWSVAFSRKIWQVAFVPILALAFIGLLISALVEGSDPSPSRQRQWRLAWAIVMYALLVQVHPSAVSLAPVLVFWLLVFRHRVRIRPLLIGGALGILTAVPFLVHQVEADWPVLTALGSLQGAEWDLSAMQLAWEAITGRSIHALAGISYPLLRLVPQLDRTFNIAGWLVVGASLGLVWRMVKRWRAAETVERQAAQIDLILLTWLVVPILFNLRHSLDLYLHFFALIVPAAYLVLGRAAGLFLTGAHTRATVWSRSLGIGCATVVAILAFSQVVTIVLMGHFVVTHDTSGGFGMPLARYMEIADDIVEVTRETSADEVLLVGQGDSIVVDPMPAIFDVLLRDRVAHRFVDGATSAVFPAHKSIVLLAPEAGEAAEWYDAWPAQELSEGYRLVMLDATWPNNSLKDIVGPRTFQNGVEVQRYTWDSEQGGTGRFWLQWQVLWLHQDDTHFFVHLMGQDEELMGQQDSVGYPTESRQKGDRILTRFDITYRQEALARPSWGRAGIYLYPQIVNLPVIDGAGNALGDAVMLGPLDGQP